MAKKSPEFIEEGLLEVFGARMHNLKNIDVQMPRNQLVCITGLSGSGKSSLAFDTIFAEGQRRYMESFSGGIHRRGDNGEITLCAGKCSRLPRRQMVRAVMGRHGHHRSGGVT